MATAPMQKQEILNAITNAKDTKTIDALILAQQIKNKRRGGDDSNRFNDADKKTIFDAMNAQTITLTEAAITAATDLKGVDKVFGDLYKLENLALILTDSTKSTLMNFAILAGNDVGVQGMALALMKAATDVTGIDKVIDTVAKLTNLYFTDAATAMLNSNVSSQVLRVVQGQVALAKGDADIQKLKASFDKTQFINFTDALSSQIDSTISARTFA